jgi:hypothetical protein
MTSQERVRAAGRSFWIPFVITVLAVVATLWSIIDPQWIERLFGASPDAGSGQSEWQIAALFAAAAVGSFAVTRWRWRAITPG